MKNIDLKSFLIGFFMATILLLAAGASKSTQDVRIVGIDKSLMCEIEEAKKFVERAIKADSSLKAEFLDDPAFDPVWESF